MAKARTRSYSRKLQMEENPSKAGKILIEIVLWIVEIAVAVLLGWLIVQYGIERMAVSGSSMEGVLSANDSVIIEKLTGKLWGYRRFDIIAFEQEQNEHRYYNVKRILGLPGETVQIVGGKLYINGEELQDVYSGEGMANAGVAGNEIVLEDNEYFVLGDNRNNSEDSRFANIGNIVKTDIIGKIWLRLSPSFAVVPMLEPDKDKADKDNVDKGE